MCAWANRILGGGQTCKADELAKVLLNLGVAWICGVGAAGEQAFDQVRVRVMYVSMCLGCRHEDAEVDDERRRFSE